jgi:hypothetical protein
MPDAVAEAVEAPAVVAPAQPALFVEVRDVADLGYCEPPLAALGGRPADLELAEIAGEIAQPLVAEALVVKHQDGVAVDRIPDAAERRRIDGLSEVHAVDLTDKERMNLPNFDAHAFSPWSAGDENLPGCRSSQSSHRRRRVVC